MLLFLHLPPTSSHLHPLQVENCDSNSQLVVDEDDNSKFRLERVKIAKANYLVYIFTLLSQICLESPIYIKTVKYFY